jgi:hypothetical protein
MIAGCSMGVNNSQKLGNSNQTSSNSTANSSVDDGSSAISEISSAGEPGSTLSATAANSQSKATNGQRTQNLSSELNRLFSGKYYYRETVKTEEPTLNVSITQTDGKNFYLLTYNTASGENEEGVAPVVILGKDMYEINHKKKTVTKVTGKSWVYGNEKDIYAAILPPVAKYMGSDTVTENGKQLFRETYKDQNGTTIQYYYDGDKLQRYDCVADGKLISSHSVEYSSKIDESLFELPKDYKIIDK